MDPPGKKIDFMCGVGVDGDENKQYQMRSERMEEESTRKDEWKT